MVCRSATILPRWYAVCTASRFSPSRHVEGGWPGSGAFSQPSSFAGATAQEERYTVIPLLQTGGSAGYRKMLGARPAFQRGAAPVQPDHQRRVRMPQFLGDAVRHAVRPRDDPVGAQACGDHLTRTEAPGQQQIVPVVHGCTSCGHDTRLPVFHVMSPRRRCKQEGMAATSSITSSACEQSPAVRLRPALCHRLGCATRAIRCAACPRHAVQVMMKWWAEGQ